MTDDEMLQSIQKMMDVHKQSILQEMDEKILSSQNALLAYFESSVQPQLKVLAEGHQGLVEKLSAVGEIKYDIEYIKGSMVALEAVLVKNKRETDRRLEHLEKVAGL